VLSQLSVTTQQIKASRSATPLQALQGVASSPQKTVHSRVSCPHREHRHLLSWIERRVREAVPRTGTPTGRLWVQLNTDLATLQLWHKPESLAYEDAAGMGGIALSTAAQARANDLTDVIEETTDAACFSAGTILPPRHPNPMVRLSRSKYPHSRLGGLHSRWSIHHPAREARRTPRCHNGVPAKPRIA